MTLGQDFSGSQNHIPRLLAVDDDVVSAELVVRVAERCGFEAFATSDSRGVVSLCQALSPTILVVDICMPNVDALQLFDLLVEANFAGRVVIVSGQDEQTLRETRSAAAEKGLAAAQYMQKPVDLSRMRSILLAEA